MCILKRMIKFENYDEKLSFKILTFYSYYYLFQTN